MNEDLQVKIVRFKSGEDIICFCYEDYKNKRILIQYPNSFYFDIDTEHDIHELYLTDWMTKEAFAYQTIYIPSDEILFTSMANVKFGYKYLYKVFNELDESTELSKRIKKTLEDILTDLNESEIDLGEVNSNQTFH